MQRATILFIWYTPEDVLQSPLHFTKCTTWVAMSKHGIICPYWFEGENERAQTELILVRTLLLCKATKITEILHNYCHNYI